MQELRRKKAESTRLRCSVPWLPDVAADFAALAASYYAILFFRFNSAAGEFVFSYITAVFGGGMHESALISFQEFYITSAPRIICLCFLLLGFLYAMHDLYACRRYLHKRPVTWRVIVANLTAMLIFVAYFYLRRNIFHPRSFFVPMLIVNTVFCPLFRLGIDSLLYQLRVRFNYETCPVLIWGGGAAADILADYMRETYPYGMYPVKHLVDDAEVPFDVRLEKLIAAAETEKARMIVCMDKSLALSHIMVLLEEAGNRDLEVKIWSDKFNVLLHHAGLSFDMLEGMPLIHFGRTVVAERYQRIKRPVDFMLALLMLLGLAPVLLLTALVIKITSRGPVLFVQSRIGVNRQPFRMYKFRTMRCGADEQREAIEELNETGRGLFKIRRDPRITTAGRFLRRFSLDELPQLMNVVRGDMAVVGPRPLPLRDFEHYYENWHYIRHAGRPGLTCLWQISGRSHLDFHNMCILDVYYLFNQSWVFDIKIMLNTVKVVVFAEGAW